MSLYTDNCQRKHPSAERKRKALTSGKGQRADIGTETRNGMKRFWLKNVIEHSEKCSQLLS